MSPDDTRGQNVHWAFTRTGADGTGVCAGTEA